MKVRIMNQSSYTCPSSTQQREILSHPDKWLEMIIVVSATCLAHRAYSLIKWTLKLKKVRNFCFKFESLTIFNIQSVIVDSC